MDDEFIYRKTTFSLERIAKVVAIGAVIMTGLLLLHSLAEYWGMIEHVTRRL